MNASTASPRLTQQSITINGHLNAPAASARPANSYEKCAIAGNYGLLSRMYPNLSPEQAAAMIHQKIMLEQLRKAATSRRRRR
jgi:hypothetical protein